MTKLVRIENADSAPYQVIVQVWDKGRAVGAPDVLIREVVLAHPCQMTGSDVYLTDTQYLVVKEG